MVIQDSSRAMQQCFVQQTHGERQDCLQRQNKEVSRKSVLPDPGTEPRSLLLL